MVIYLWKWTSSYLRTFKVLTVLERNLGFSEVFFVFYFYLELLSYRTVFPGWKGWVSCCWSWPTTCPPATCRPPPSGSSSSWCAARAPSSRCSSPPWRPSCRPGAGGASSPLWWRFPCRRRRHDSGPSLPAAQTPVSAPFIPAVRRLRPFPHPQVINGASAFLKHFLHGINLAIEIALNCNYS